MIELILTQDLLPNGYNDIAKSGDSVILKDDGTFEVKKAYSDWNLEAAESKEMMEADRKKKETDDTKKSVDTQEAHEVARRKAQEHAEKVRQERPKDFGKEYDPRIEKYLSIDKEKSWALLTKFYNDGHLDSYQILKDFINKIATCPDVSEKFDKVMMGWMSEGEADTSAVEKVINACKKGGGNVEKTGEHSDKMKDCLKDVDTEGGKYNKYAVCNASVGKSIIEEVIDKKKKLQ